MFAHVYLHHAFSCVRTRRWLDVRNGVGLSHWARDAKASTSTHKRVSQGRKPCRGRRRRRRRRWAKPVISNRRRRRFKEDDQHVARRRRCRWQ